MPSDINHRGSVRFDVYEVDLENGELRKKGTPVSLQPQPFKVLALLVSHPGQIITREEFKNEVWGTDTFVDFERGLNFCIRQIRVALNDDRETPKYIGTVPRRGYRFVAAVKPSAASQPELEAVTEAAKNNDVPIQPEVRENVGRASVSNGRGRLSRSWIAAVGIALATGAAFVLWWKLPLPNPQVTAVTQLTDDGQPKWGRLVTDGSRVYFNEGNAGNWKVAQVSVAGGQTAFVDTRLADPHVAGLAADGSSLLTMLGTGPVDPLWLIPLPGGEPRRLGNIEAYDAGMFPDGRVVFTRGNALSIAANDGTSPHKLAEGRGTLIQPSVSPDGTRISVTDEAEERSRSLLEAASDGTWVHEVLRERGVGCGSWTADGRYLVFQRQRDRSWDLWAISEASGIRRRSHGPLRLTDGALSYSNPMPSRDGKTIFAIGSRPRGELVRYDSKSQQFIPYLSGTSAIDATFSKNGEWVAYLSYPDHTLWRSRTDGSQRRQLTYPPLVVTYPRISPDGTRVAFSTTDDEVYVISMAGGPAQKESANSQGPTWSPDGNLLVVTSTIAGKHLGENRWSELQTIDLRSGKATLVGNSQGTLGGFWVRQDVLVAAVDGLAGFSLFDFRTEKWTSLISGWFVNWFPSADGKYLYCVTGGSDPKVVRVRFADHRAETVAGLKDLRRVVDVYTGLYLGASPDGSVLVTRDRGTQEIYALSMRFP